MYLKYIKNEQFDQFVKLLICENTNTTILREPNNRFVNVFTNSLIGSFNITDFECVNIETGKIYSKQWRKFMIEQLDKLKLGNDYIDRLHDHLEAETIVGPVL